MPVMDMEMDTPVLRSIFHMDDFNVLYMHVLVPSDVLMCCNVQHKNYH